MALYWRKKVLLAKIETTYGTDPTPTGVANAILAVDVKLNPMEGQDIERGLDLPWFANDGTIPADLHMKLSFKVELQASGALGVAPAWGPLIRACGWAQTIVASTSVTYNPISSGLESATFYLNIDGQLHVMKGARGTCKLTIGAQSIPYLEFSFQGLFAVPTDTAAPTPTLTGFKDPLAASAANTPVFTLGGVSLVLRSLTFDFGNKLENRFLIGGSSAAHSVQITDRAETLEMNVEAVAMSTLNPFSLAQAMTTSVVALQHGTAAGYRATLNVPALQLQRPANLDNTQNILEWPLRGIPKPVSGNDQATLVLT